MKNLFILTLSIALTLVTLKAVELGVVLAQVEHNHEMIKQTNVRMAQMFDELQETTRKELSMKHSNMPWRQFGFSILAADDQAVCTLEPTPAEPEKAQANANLITAAPEMLEALEMLYQYEAGRSSPDTAWHTNMMQSARSAIAAAKGTSK